jgi:hypothetical protein
MSSIDKSRADEAAEKHKWKLKYFDYGETPIKEWVAETLGEDVDTIFEDYVEDSDVLSVECQGKFYTFYLAIFPATVPAFNATNSDLMANEILKRATSMMFDAVYTVYAPVVKTMYSMGYKMEDIFPKFDNVNMCFEFCMVNKPKMEKQQIVNTLANISEQLSRATQVNIDDDEKKEKVAEYTAQLIKMQTEELAKLHLITDEICDERELLCDDVNKKFQDGVKLYICLDIDKPKDDDQVMKRMPKFGLEYQDPDEENYIDKFKKECNMDS